MEIVFKESTITELGEISGKIYDKFIEFGHHKQKEYNLTGKINFDDFMFISLMFIAPRFDTSRENELIQLYSVLKKSVQNQQCQIKTKKGNNKNSIDIKSINIIVFLFLEVNNKMVELLNFYHRFGRPGLDKNMFLDEFLTVEELKELGVNDVSFFSKNDKKKFYKLCSEEQYKSIVDYVNSSQDRRYSKNINNLIYEISYKLKKAKIFRDDLKTIATNEACFIYDILSFFDITAENFSLSNQEKYQFIKRMIK